MNKVVFVHIPKTSGTNTVGLLAKNYSAVCPYSMIEHYLEADDLDEYELFGGHISFSTTRLLSKPLTVVTFLRDPIEHPISYHKFAGRPGSMHYYKELARTLSLEKFIQNSATRNIVQNIQTRYLGLDGLSAKTTREFESLNIDDWDEVLDRAKANLRSFLFVGLKERYVKSVRSMFARLGLKYPTGLRQLHKKHKEEVSAGVLDQIRDMNWCDLELYNYARELFWG